MAEVQINKLIPHHDPTLPFVGGRGAETRPSGCWQGRKLSSFLARSY